jgi:hypothetical protein
VDDPPQKVAPVLFGDASALMENGEEAAELISAPAFPCSGGSELFFNNAKYKRRAGNAEASRETRPDSRK